MIIQIIVPLVLQLFGSKEYQAGVYAVPLIVCVTFLTSLYNLYSNEELYNKESGRIASATVVAAITNSENWIHCRYIYYLDI